jgi:beta-glucosidase
MRRRNDQINKVISAYADNKNITYLNINQKLLNNENKLDIEIMPDLLHPNNKGYHIWAEAMQAPIMKLLK